MDDNNGKDDQIILNIVQNKSKKSPSASKKQKLQNVKIEEKFSDKQSNLNKEKKIDIERRENFTSSLFKNNPEIGSLTIFKERGIQEKLFSKISFNDLNLHPHLISCLKSRLNVTTLTQVQARTIPLLLKNKDALVKSCTGSGKTLAYSIPIVQKLQEKQPKIERSDGLFALIIVPTRELAIQSFECFSTLTKAFTWIVPGYLIGGEKKKSEKARIRKGINILVSTPGRLLDHLEHTSNLSLEKIEWLVIDEADKLLEQGFEESVAKIISKCNRSRQSVLLSATLSKGVENLAGMSLTDPICIDISAPEEINYLQDVVIPCSLKQYAIVVPPKLRLVTLSAFLIDKALNGNFKVLIFMFSQNSVDFHYSLFSGVLAEILKEKGCKCKLFRLHGSMKQEERREIFNSFRTSKEGILLCTDVAARGLDVPQVDWIVQYSAPPSIEIYAHRAGRTARAGKKGNSLLFLLPSELNFSKLLAEHKLQLEELPITKVLETLLLLQTVFKGNLSTRGKSVQDCATELQLMYEKTVYLEEELHKNAKEAYASYIQSYASYPKTIRDILPFRALHLGHIAKSFCLREAPSKLNCKIPGIKAFTPKDKIKKISVKRKQSAIISEYDSGLSELNKMSFKKSFKKKRIKFS